MFIYFGTVYSSRVMQLKSTPCTVASCVSNFFFFYFSIVRKFDTKYYLIRCVAMECDALLDSSLSLRTCMEGKGWIS